MSLVTVWQFTLVSNRARKLGINFTVCNLHRWTCTKRECIKTLKYDHYFFMLRIIRLIKIELKCFADCWARTRIEWIGKEIKLLSFIFRYLLKSYLLIQGSQFVTFYKQFRFLNLYSSYEKSKARVVWGCIEERIIE